MPPVVLAQAGSLDVWTLVMESGPMAKFVLLVLAVFSVVSWGIIAERFRTYRAAEREYFQAVEAGLDAFITGEATEWVMHQAAEDGVHYIAAGHYATERFGVRALGRGLENKHAIEVSFVDLPNPV